MKRCPSQLIQAMAHPVELPDSSPELIKKFEDGRKTLTKFGGDKK